MSGFKTTVVFGRAHIALYAGVIKSEVDNEQYKML